MQSIRTMTFARPVAVLLVLLSSICSAADEAFKWLTDLDRARQLAASEGRPLLIVFR